MEEVLEFWIKELELTEYNIRFVPISREQVLFVGDFPEEDKFFIGIDLTSEGPDIDFYHDRPLQEDDIVHELLHLRFKTLPEEDIRFLTRKLM